MQQKQHGVVCLNYNVYNIYNIIIIIWVPTSQVQLLHSVYLMLLFQVSIVFAITLLAVSPTKNLKWGIHLASCLEQLNMSEGAVTQWSMHSVHN